VVRPRSLLALERAMADPKGFLTAPRQDCASRPVRERVRDWNEVYDRQSLLPVIGTQAGRCMDCGIPFCHHGCPLGNLIPEWNDLVWRGDWAARERAAARHQQLSRVHRQALPGTLRAGLRAGH
jgi:ferredoxin